MNHTELIARLSAMWAQLDPVDEWMAKAVAAGLTLQAWVELRCSGKR